MILHIYYNDSEHVCQEGGRIVSLKFALLGQLSKRAMTGYELKQFVDQAIAHFWAADHTQIYRTLNNLEAEGLVASTIEIQEDRPNRKRYTVTPAGQSALQDWLLKHQPLPVYRDAFLVQLFFAHDLPDARLIELLQQQLQGHQEKIQAYNATRALIRQTAADAREEQMELWTLELGLAVESVYGAWIEQLIAHLRT